MRAHARESRFDQKRSEELWIHERDMWLDEDEPEQEEVSTHQTFEDFLPTGLSQLDTEPSVWVRGQAVLDAMRGQGAAKDAFGEALTLEVIESMALAHNLSLEEVASVCIAIVESAHELYDTPTAEKLVDAALNVLPVIDKAATVSATVTRGDTIVH